MKRYIRKLAAILTTAAILTPTAGAEVTLTQCLEKAESNYPLISRYGLTEQTLEINLSDINKGWLPRIGVYGQATVQNDVPEFPGTLKNILTQLGQDYKGLGHVQYKLGVDVSQTVWDGGASKAGRQIERASAAERQAALDVQMYAVREKVINLYFGILLIDSQIRQTENTIKLLEANLKLMQSKHKEGVAMQSDVDQVEAQLLTLRQQLASARNAGKSYRDVLSVYIGESLGDENLEIPVTTALNSGESDRPELKLFEAQTHLNAAREESIGSSVMPKIGIFAQAYYGYPGFNYFESMMKRNLSFNLLAGIKISWDIDSFYTKKNSLKKLATANAGINADRDLFLFNTRLQTSSQRQDIAGMQAVMADDAKIVALRESVRKAAESQLRNGVIDATSLLSRITDENQARLTAAYHEIQLLHNIYKLKYTLNR